MEAWDLRNISLQAVLPVPADSRTHTARLCTQLATPERVNYRPCSNHSFWAVDGGLRAWRKASSRISLYLADSK